MNERPPVNYEQQDTEKLAQELLKRIRMHFGAGLSPEIRTALILELKKMESPVPTPLVIEAKLIAAQEPVAITPEMIRAEVDAQFDGRINEKMGRLEQGFLTNSGDDVRARAFKLALDRWSRLISDGGSLQSLYRTGEVWVGLSKRGYATFETAKESDPLLIKLAIYLAPYIREKIFQLSDDDLRALFTLSIHIIKFNDLGKHYEYDNAWQRCKSLIIATRVADCRREKLTEFRDFLSQTIAERFKI